MTLEDVDAMEVFERLCLENKYVHQLFDRFTKLRFFYTLREAALREKYEKRL
jgi:hypothetical protein